MQTHTWEVGDEFAGFKVLSIETLDEYQGVGYHFEHIETGMEVFQLVNDDRERFFSYIFKTLPSNDSGVAHILEHCVLSGSERFPVRDPFMGLLKGSVNTFMNAMTYPDKTLYPAASPLKADFDNLFSVYTDAVFSPLLREETFWREGVRMVCDDEGCHYEGVVFNEMLGDGSDHDSIVGRSSVRSLYPDTAYSFNSGGDPEQIIKLDYQQFVSFHSQFYHPSNAKLFIYGDLEVGEKLAYLDEHYLRTRGSLNVNSTVGEAQRWKAERAVSFTSPTEDEGANANSVVWAWATERVTDSLAVITLSTLVDILLGNPAAPLYKAILESEIGEDISPESGMRAEFMQMAMLIGFKGIALERAEEGGQFILDTLAQIAKDGIDRDLIASSLKRSRFRLLEIPGGAPNGLRLLNRSLRGWVYGDGPTATIGAAEPLAALERELEENPRYFEEWIINNLLENPHRCLVTVKGDPEHHARQLDAIARHAQSVAETLGKKGIKEIIAQNERFAIFDESGDSAQALASIPRLTIEDLPVEVKENHHQEVLCAGQPLYIRSRHCNTIRYVNIAINVEDLNTDELMLLPFYIRLVQMSGIGERSYVEIATKTKDLLGDFGLFLEMGSTFEDTRIQAILCRTKVLAEDAEAAFDLVSQILTQTNVDDPLSIKQVLSTLRGEYRDSVSYAAHSFASLSAASRLSEVQHEGELLAGLSQWLFLEAKGSDDIPHLAKQMKDLQKKLNNRSRLTLHLLSDEGDEVAMKPILEGFVTAFADGKKVQRAQRSYPQLAPDSVHALSLYRLPSSVSYQAYAIRAAKRGTPLQAAQALLAQVMSGNELWELIRGKGGAYGVGATVDVMEQVFLFSTYRDPRIGGSFTDLVTTLEGYAAGNIDPAAVKSALISMVGTEMRPLSPSQESLLAFRRLLYKITDAYRARRREQLLATDEQMIGIAAQALLTSAQNADSRTVIAGSQLLEKEREKSGFADTEVVALPL